MRPKSITSKLAIFALALVCLSVVGCATTRQPNATVAQGAPIRLPDPPERVEIAREDVPREPGVTYLDEPKRLAPNETWKAYPDGAYVWKNRDLRGILYALQEPPKWISRTQEIIRLHNEKMGLVEQKEQDKKESSWWQIWKRK